MSHRALAFSVARTTAYPAATSSNVSSASGLLNRNISTATGVSAHTAAAVGPARRVRPLVARLVWRSPVLPFHDDPGPEDPTAQQEEPQQGTGEVRHHQYEQLHRANGVGRHQVQQRQAPAGECEAGEE